MTFVKELEEEDNNTVPKGTASSLKSLNTTFLKIVLSTAKHNLIFLWARCGGFLSENLRKRQRQMSLESR